MIERPEVKAILIGLAVLLGVATLWAIPILVCGLLSNWSEVGVAIGSTFPIIAVLVCFIAFLLGETVMTTRWYRNIERRREERIML